ncbi:hypothetical protein [Paracoccus lutimaris]|uniref:Excalibur calcium-binding domain-containing protein n=1 Tax=Paracoccus lutimaris TaxID=1490030 RepID=A0A368Z0D8_9RHOB|nr:hypothetical protein [Paracoccus lutimaris]RCW85922.1 hypothetical protein DFP89_105189 [Paracoccus lutimaris]
MRNLVILSVLALAACGENTGWNPNYSGMHNGTSYAKYMHEREAALHGRGAVPSVIPVELPAKAPTAAEIAGTVPTQTKAAGTVTVTARAPKNVPATMPVTTSGPYPGSTPVLVRYAHQEQQNPGSQVYKRPQARTGGSVLDAGRSCSGYASADIAQRAFISAGGPILDPKGMDPDGDGFVCGWDPRPVRNASGL